MVIFYIRFTKQKSVKISSCEAKEKLPIKDFDFLCEKINETAGKFERLNFGLPRKMFKF